jgi:hypothetical protein
MASFVLLNRDGWIVTAAHVFDLGHKADQDREHIADHQKRVDAIRQAQGVRDNVKRRELREAQRLAKADWITAISYWWGRDGLELRDLSIMPDADLAVGRLNPMPSDLFSVAPVLKNPSASLDPGTSLCRLGFPFHEVKAAYDEATNRFSLEGPPLTHFPIEGIFTRSIDAGQSADGKHRVKFVETSSPGLKGQSGGPIYDIRGRVWGIQSRTYHVPLGFNPDVEVNGRKVVEHQFINLGVGTHPETLVAALGDLNVAFEISED